MTTLSMLKIRVALVVAALAVASLSPALRAQNSTMRMQVTVPFGFEVGPNHFAAGIYTLSQSREHILSIAGTKSFALVLNRRERSLKPSSVGAVVFDRYGNRYFLREMRAKGDIDYFRFPESKAEQQVKKIQQAANRASIATPANVEFALLENAR